MTDSTVLPLLNLQANHNRRQYRTPQWTSILCLITRRRIKPYLIMLALLVIVILTIAHKMTLTDRHNNNQRPVNLKTKPAMDKGRFAARTMRTVIGRYVGPKPSWATSDAQNVSQELLNSNNYDPDPDMGQNGKPAYLPGYPKDQLKALYSINRFNLAASDKISVDRKLPDPRKLACRKRDFDEQKLPNTSIIIVFHNEAWSTLVRTVHSILNTAPKHLLAEILLVDDASNRTFLAQPLKYYMNNLGSVRGVEIKILRSIERIGLIRARLLGVEQAHGHVLTFIDAHCEATKGWLEPLLEQIKLDRTTAACPIIDIINEDTFAYTRSFELHLGAFNWGLNFRWFPISRRELNASNSRLAQVGKIPFELMNPFRTPVMAGGLFSIERDYFNEIGKYDSHMDIWGGENIELSLRLWQCGGQVKIVPCSHVAHIFRKSSPYTFRAGREVGDILYTNLARVADVWMDEWADFFYTMNPIVNRTLHKVGRAEAFVEIESRKELRRSLGCKSFAWFLDNVWPEHFFPKRGRFFGKLRQDATGRCIQRPTVRIGMGQATVGAVEAVNCSTLSFPSSQLFVYNPDSGALMSDENICLDTGSDPIPTRQIILAPCSESKRQVWRHTSDSWLKHEQSELCLSSQAGRAKVELATCSSAAEELRWSIVEVNWRVGK